MWAGTPAPYSLCGASWSALPGSWETISLMWREFYLPSLGLVAGGVPKGCAVRPVSGAVTTQFPKLGDTSLGLPQTYLGAVRMDLDWPLQFSSLCHVCCPNRPELH